MMKFFTLISDNNKINVSYNTLQKYDNEIINVIDGNCDSNIIMVHKNKVYIDIQFENLKIIIDYLRDYTIDFTDFSEIEIENLKFDCDRLKIPSLFEKLENFNKVNLSSVIAENTEDMLIRSSEYQRSRKIDGNRIIEYDLKDNIKNIENIKNVIGVNSMLNINNLSSEKSISSKQSLKIGDELLSDGVLDYDNESDNSGVESDLDIDIDINTLRDLNIASATEGVSDYDLDTDIISHVSPVNNENIEKYKLNKSPTSISVIKYMNKVSTNNDSSYKKYEYTDSDIFIKECTTDTQSKNIFGGYSNFVKTLYSNE